MGTKIDSFEDLLVWQASVRLTKSIYVLTKSFPADEKFGLTRQVKESAASVAANIAEGHGRRGLGHYLQFLHYALGSLYETKSHLILAQELGFYKADLLIKFREKIVEIEKMLKSLIKSLEKYKK